jgi:hypothetical protein
MASQGFFVSTGISQFPMPFGAFSKPFRARCGLFNELACEVVVDKRRPCTLYLRLLDVACQNGPEVLWPAEWQNHGDVVSAPCGCRRAAHPWDAARQRGSMPGGAIPNAKHRRDWGFDSDELA